MLRPNETVQKLLLSTPARFIGEYTSDDFVLTHSWDFDRIAHDDRSPLLRTYLMLTFTTQELTKDVGVVVPDYSPTGDMMCAYLAVLFGKRFDHHGAIEMSGHYRVPNLASANELCAPTRPFHGPDLRADYPIELNLSNLAIFRPLIDEQVADQDLLKAFQTAALFYSRALRAISHDPEVAYLHLITACERLAEAAPLSAIEHEAEIRTALARIEQEIHDGDRISRIFRVRLRQLKRRFSALLTTHLDADFFTRTEAEEPWGGFKAEDFPQAAKAAYDLRSRYVHTGASFATWVEPRRGRSERQMGKPVVDDKEFGKILWRAPTFIGLERLTRFVLLKCAEQLGVTLPPAAAVGATNSGLPS